jgi:hypothetical protein
MRGLEIRVLCLCPWLIRRGKRGDRNLYINNPKSLSGDGVKIEPDAEQAISAVLGFLYETSA